MFTQLKKTFNGTTVRGRANVAKATYGLIALLYLFIRIRRKKVPPLLNQDCQKTNSACPNVEAGENGAAVGAAGVTAGATAAATAATAKDSNGAATGNSSDSSKTAGEELKKPCKRVEPKDMSPLAGEV